MKDLCDLKIHVNGQHAFFVSQKIVSPFSGRLRKMIERETKKDQDHQTSIKINGFPGGPHAFELAARFCYSNGRISITPSNVPVLHCAAIFLEMTEDFSPCNLLHQTEAFLDGLFYWTWAEILDALKASASVFAAADSSGLLPKLISSLLAKIAANSDVGLSSSSSSSSPETPSSTAFQFLSCARTPDSIKRASSSWASWWFDELTVLSPKIIARIATAMRRAGLDSNTSTTAKFLLHYLKTAMRRRKRGSLALGSDYGSLADRAVDGVVSAGNAGFSFRGLFWVSRVVTGVGCSKEKQSRLEALIGGMLDRATLDDLLVSGQDGGVYDINLVLRLIRVFVATGEDGMCMVKMKKVGRLIDDYMAEISPDPSLKVSKFLAIAESLPDSARNCYDGVYRAIDIYLESHPVLPEEERSRLCRCLNYEKLTLQACKYLAKSPKIPPRIAIQALSAQQSKFQSRDDNDDDDTYAQSPSKTWTGMPVACVVSPPEDDVGARTPVEKEEMRLNLMKMQCRVMELEKVCREMKGQMSKMVKNRVIVSPAHNRAAPKLC